jgi:cell division protein FtsB
MAGNDGAHKGRASIRERFGVPRAPKKRISRPEDRESRNAEKARIREERLRRLMEMRAPERQVLQPRPNDGLKFMPLSRFMVAFGCIVIFIAGLLALIHLAQVHTQLVAEVNTLSQKQQRLKEKNGHLKAKLERLTVLDDLEIVAKESLGLYMPKTGQIVVLE